jgi:hypothetical protein
VAVTRRACSIPPVPGGESLSPFPFPLSSERGQRRVAAGTNTATAVYRVACSGRIVGIISSALYGRGKPIMVEDARQ